MQPPPSIPSLLVSTRHDRETIVTGRPVRGCINRGHRGVLPSPAFRHHPNTQVIRPQERHPQNGLPGQGEVVLVAGRNRDERVTPSQEGGQFLG